MKKSIRFALLAACAAIALSACEQLAGEDKQPGNEGFGTLTVNVGGDFAIIGTRAYTDAYEGDKRDETLRCKKLQNISATKSKSNIAMQALVKTGGASRVLGASLDETITSIGILANNGLKAEEYLHGEIN